MAKPRDIAATRTTCFLVIVFPFRCEPTAGPVPAGRYAAADRGFKTRPVRLGIRAWSRHPERPGAHVRHVAARHVRQGPGSTACFRGSWSASSTSAAASRPVAHRKQAPRRDHDAPTVLTARSLEARSTILKRSETSCNLRNLAGSKVPRGGIGPPTRGFSVPEIPRAIGSSLWDAGGHDLDFMKSRLGTARGSKRVEAAGIRRTRQRHG